MTAQELKAKLKELPTWNIQDNKLHREFKFKNFSEAWGFMTQIAILAEQMNHHPEWCNVYNRVVIDLTTHEANGISQRDFDLARKINEFLDEKKDSE